MNYELPEAVDWFWKQIEPTLIDNDGNPFDIDQHEERLSKIKELWIHHSDQELFKLKKTANYLRWLADGKDTYAAVVIMGTGSSDDSFYLEFLPWLVFQGRDFYERTLQDVNHLIGIAANVTSPEFKGLTGELYALAIGDLWEGKQKGRDSWGFDDVSNADTSVSFSYQDRLFPSSEDFDQEEFDPDVLAETYPILHAAFQR